ncbi:SDR family oxidoreductase [Sphingomicrobium nitratireducens]|uniref:SDR family oxidoreductase n=1 Tax=Sphingomicrobium nitratireducens TaxID=2964666 RepID=UPI00223F2ECF|nr:SDR family oxidoreductase [Sphingomicrobium nitratireducens]
MPSIVITGASRGIGKGLAEAYAGEGWDVIATARSDGDLAMLSAIDGVEAHRLDVTDEASRSAFVDAVGDRPVDVLLNNAGILDGGPPSVEAWQRSFLVNTIAPTLLSQALADNVAASERKVIALMSSKVGSIDDNSGGGIVMYRSSKTAANMAFKCLEIELAPRGISTVILHPGWVQTEMGGENALIDVATSVAGLRERIAETSSDNSGRFVTYDGQPIAW